MLPTTAIADYDYAATSFNSMLGLGTLAALFIILYVVPLVLAGIVLYYFTGSKPGAHIFQRKMQFIARLYAHSFMFLATFMGLFGIASLFRLVLGGLFPAFVYAKSQIDILRSVDLQNGLVYGIFALIIFGVHWGIAYLVETKQQRFGTVLSKGFIGVGLIITAFLTFGSLMNFVLQLVAYAQYNSSISRGASVYPGGALALFFAAAPIWGYYVYKVLTWIRHEK